MELEQQTTTYVEKNLRRIFSIASLVYNHQGISLSELQKLAGFRNQKQLRLALQRLMMFGIPPFSPADFITVHIDDKQKVWLDFPLGLESPLALSSSEWTVIQKLLREELEYITKNNLVSDQIRELLGRLSGLPIEFESSDSTRTQRVIIQEALQDNLQLEFRYRNLSSRQAEIRRVDPWILFKYSGTSYLIAYCHTRAASRCFLLERVQELVILDLERENEIPQALDSELTDLAIFRKEAIGFTVKIAFAKNLLVNVRRIFRFRGSVTPCKVSTLPSHWLEVSFKVQDSIWFRSVIRGLGREAVILEPQHSRKLYLQELNELSIPEELSHP